MSSVSTEQSVICTICLNSFSETNLPYQTECNHLYHVDCINTWLNQCTKSNKDHKCPYCQKPIDINKLKPIHSLIRLKEDKPF